MGREIVTSAEILKQELKRIYAEREGVFKEMMDHTEALPKTVGMDAPLVDREGFPRSDVDVAAVRGHRQKIIMLKNDHRALTDKLEELLTQLHAQSKGRSSSSEATASQASQHSAMPAANGSASHITQSSAPQQSRPFALVSSVGPSSPAEAADIQPGDRVIRFGNVSSQDQDSFGSLSLMMREGSRDPIEVTCLRQGVMHTTTIHPQPWSGPGLVGIGLMPC